MRPCGQQYRHLLCSYGNDLFESVACSLPNAIHPLSSGQYLQILAGRRVFRIRSLRSSPQRLILRIHLHTTLFVRESYHELLSTSPNYLESFQTNHKPTLGYHPSLVLDRRPVSTLLSRGCAHLEHLLSSPTWQAALQRQPASACCLASSLRVA